jgi:hypothetical protein
MPSLSFLFLCCSLIKRHIYHYLINIVFAQVTNCKRLCYGLVCPLVYVTGAYAHSANLHKGNTTNIEKEIEM